MLPLRCVVAHVDKFPMLGDRHEWILPIDLAVNDGKPFETIPWRE